MCLAFVVTNIRVTWLNKVSFTGDVSPELQQSIAFSSNDGTNVCKFAIIIILSKLTKLILNVLDKSRTPKESLSLFSQHALL